MQADLLIVQPCEFMDNGDAVYRFHAPSRALSRLPGVVVVDIDLTHRLFWYLAEQADVLILAGASADLFTLMERRRTAGRITVMEANDYYYDIQPWNPLSERWLDRGLQDMFGHLMEKSDAIQTSMPELERRWRLRTPHPVAAFMNQLTEVPPLSPPRSGKPFTIGWGGSPGHFADWYYLAPLLQRWLDAHPEVHLAVMNNEFAKPFLQLEAHRYHYKDFGSLHSYLHFVRGLDIGLAPLLPTEYNRCRSDVKFLEYASQGVPGIYADLEPYRSTVVHEKTGLMYRSDEEFLHMLDRLYADAALRQSIREQAFGYVSTSRLLTDHIQKRLEFYRKLLPAGMPRGATLPPEVLSCAVQDGRYLQLRPQQPEETYKKLAAAPANADTVRGLEKLLAELPQYLPALQLLGQRLNDLRKSDAALHYLERARAIDPQSARTLCELGRAHFLRNEVQKGRQILEQALGSNPHYQVGWQYLVRLLTLSNATDGAAWAERVHAANPSNFALALLSIKLFPPLEQMTALSRYLELYAPTFLTEEMPGAAAAFSETIRDAAQAALYTPQCVQLLRRATEVFPHSAQMANLLGLALRAAGQPQEAMAQHQRALELRRAAHTYKAEFPQEDGIRHYWQFAEHIRSVTGC